jgi:hypothetical protein
MLLLLLLLLLLLRVITKSKWPPTVDNKRGYCVHWLTRYFHAATIMFMHSNYPNCRQIRFLNGSRFKAVQTRAPSCTGCPIMLE